MSDQQENDVYVRCLTPRGHGYPLWDPTPSQHPFEHNFHGVRIGDVGCISPEGSFSYLFNVTLPAGDPANEGRTPPDFEHVELNDTVDIERKPFWRTPMKHVASSSMVQTTVDVGISFSPGPTTMCVL